MEGLKRVSTAPSIPKLLWCHQRHTRDEGRCVMCVMLQKTQDADGGTKSDEIKQHLHPEADRYKLDLRWTHQDS